MKIKKGDTIKMLYGKDSGKTGTVTLVNSRQGKVLVAGLNMFKRHVKGDGQTKKSEIVSVARQIQAAKVMVVCPECSKTTRVGMKLEGKNYVRVCKKCGKPLDKKVEKVVKKETKAVKAEPKAKKETKVKKSTK
ncbi:MAG TPA: 50S ribosomal protein L24 [Candidatus Dojkabacteria bacterium]|nr:50S ribosomal protein L24 [Candidatus Dojkabacteria bacterium]